MQLLKRRNLMAMTASGLATLAVGCSTRKSPAHDAHDEHSGNGEAEEAEEVAPPEDLMREHGVLNRILLIYEECARRLETPAEMPPLEALNAASTIIRRFIEDYHERLEEDFLFPRFEAKGMLVELVATLRRQHEAGRRVTYRIQSLAASGLKDATSRPDSVAALRAFVRMYRPHEAREDTVLFPSLRRVVTPKEFEDLGERFEAKEHELFGKPGFEGIVAQVDAIEKTLGINDLNRFTPA